MIGTTGYDGVVAIAVQDAKRVNSSHVADDSSEIPVSRHASVIRIRDDSCDVSPAKTVFDVYSRQGYERILKDSEGSMH